MGTVYQALAVRDVQRASGSPSVASGQQLTPPADSNRGDISPCVWSATAFRRSFPELWGEYLRETYRTAYAVQRAFPGIDSKTARDWIGGKRDPSGSFVAAVVARDPNALKILGRTA